MIEFCTKKRMAAAIVLLVVLSVIVLVYENGFSVEYEHKDVTKAPGNKSKECWEEYPTEVKEECQPCTGFEKSEVYCLKTGYRELVRCNLPGNIPVSSYKSCPKQSWLEERNFWIFEAATALIGFSAYSVVYIRQKTLDKIFIEKVHKQIAAGV